MRIIFRTILFLMMAAILNSCAGLSGAVKLQNHDPLNSIVPEPFHFNIQNKITRNYLKEVNINLLPLDRKLEVILLTSLANVKGENDLAMTFDNLWQNHEKVRELVNNPEQREGLI